MESARETRRRKILERGSDRLAFITGQARSLPPSNQVNAQGTGVLTSEFGSTTGHELSSGDITVNESQRKTELVNDEAKNKTPWDQSQNGDGVELLLKGETGNEATGASMQTSETAEPLVTPTLKGLPTDATDMARPHVIRTSSHQVFELSQITSSIAATENVRLFCAVTIALLVVLSYHGYPPDGKILRSLINWRPIYLVLLTDLTLMVGLLMASRGHETEAKARRAGQEDGGLVDNVGKALELGMVFQKLLNAVFMDCCVCALIMIAGIPLGAVMDVV